MNIAEILKHKPKGTKLYSPAFGVLTFQEIHEYDNMIDVNEVGIGAEGLSFYFDGRFTLHGESVLFPSKQMRDWSKFAWQAGSFLMDKDKKSVVMFCDWASDDYTKFKGVGFSMPREKIKTVYDTCDYEDFDVEHYSLEGYINPTTGAFGFKAEPKESIQSINLNPV